MVKCLICIIIKKKHHKSKKWFLSIYKFYEVKVLAQLISKNKHICWLNIQQS